MEVENISVPVHVVVKKRKVDPEVTFRDNVVVVPAAVVEQFNFIDTKPNHVVIVNNSANVVLVSSSMNVSDTVFEFQIAAGKRFQCVFGTRLTSINLFCTAGATVRLLSYAAPLDPVAMGLANG